MIAAIVVSAIPMIGLIILWSGPSPENEIRYLYIEESFRFHPRYLTLYIAQAFIYLVPWVAWKWRYFYGDYRVWLVAVFLSLLYWLYPVQPCPAAQQANIITVGYFHKLLRLIGVEPVEQIVFYASYLLGWPVVIRILIDSYERLRKKSYDFVLLLDFSILLFLFIMPFSYLFWEKYFMSIVPLLLLQIVLIHLEQKGRPLNIVFAVPKALDQKASNPVFAANFL